MKKLLLLGICTAALVATTFATPSEAVGNDWSNRKAQWFAMQYPWHAQYAHWRYGQPVALVVPPTANAQTSWSWGVGSARMTPLYHQYGRPYPGDGGGRDMCPFYPTPHWPSSTDQFGVYYIRGPW
jgi:hypothetical protein